MIPRTRGNPLAYPPERRQGFIDPREHDYPPFSPGHPFGGKRRNCTCCSPGCSCCVDRNVPPHSAKSHVLRRSPAVKHRRYSVPSSPWSAWSITYHDPHSRSLPNRLEYPSRSPTSPVSWPFLRHSTASSQDDDHDHDHNHETSTQRSSGSILGPLGALIAELNSSPATAQIRTPFPFPVPHEHRDEFTQQDMRQLWAHWVRKRGCRDGEGRGEVERGKSRLVTSEVDDAGWRCAEVHGWI
jgi:hypothetical protein